MQSQLLAYVTFSTIFLLCPGEQGIIKKQKLNVLTTPEVGTVLRPRPQHASCDVGHSYSLFALSLPTEVITIFIDDVLLRYFDIFKNLLVWVCARSWWETTWWLIVVFWPL